MNLLNYSKLGFYLKLLTAILAVSYVGIMVSDGFFAQNVSASNKGWNMILALGYLMFAVLISISAFKV